MLPLGSSNESRVGYDLKTRRLQQVVQFVQALGLALCHETVKLIGGGGFGRDLVDVVVESLGILDRGGKSVVLVVQRGEEVVLLQAEFPEGPRPPWIVHVVQDGESRLVETVRGSGFGEESRNWAREYGVYGGGGSRVDGVPGSGTGERKPESRNRLVLSVGYARGSCIGEDRTVEAI